MPRVGQTIPQDGWKTRLSGGTSKFEPLWLAGAVGAPPPGLLVATPNRSKENPPHPPAPPPPCPKTACRRPSRFARHGSSLGWAPSFGTLVPRFCGCSRKTRQENTCCQLVFKQESGPSSQVFSMENGKGFNSKKHPIVAAHPCANCTHWLGVLTVKPYLPQSQEPCGSFISTFHFHY